MIDMRKFGLMVLARITGVRFDLISFLIFSFIYILLFWLSVDFYSRSMPLQRQVLVSANTLGAESDESSNFTSIQEPILSEIATQPLIYAKSALVVDLGTGKALYQKNPEDPVFPASTTKIITAMVTLDSYDLDQTVIVSKISVDGQKMGLKIGEKISVENLLYGLLVYSANDAAEALAANYPGGRDIFIAAMNVKAKELGLSASLFTNPTGLDHMGQVTTATDLVRASVVAMENPIFAKIVATKEITVNSIDGVYSHKLTNINKLLGVVDGVLGVKTGFTEEARENLVTYLERDGRKIMLVLLGSSDRFGETKKLIVWIFENYHWGVAVGDVLP